MVVQPVGLQILFVVAPPLRQKEGGQCDRFDTGTESEAQLGAMWVGLHHISRPNQPLVTAGVSPSWQVGTGVEGGTASDGNRSPWPTDYRKLFSLTVSFSDSVVPSCSDSYSLFSFIISLLLCLPLLQVQINSVQKHLGANISSKLSCAADVFAEDFFFLLPFSSKLLMK